jgi:hypothetical protein
VNSGTINIGLSVNGGTFDNSGTINGTFNTSGTNTAINIRSGSKVEANAVSTVGVGSSMILSGDFNNNADRLTIEGYLTGSGSVTDYTGDTAGNKGRLEINGLFTPGGSNVIGTFKVNGRFDLNASVPDGRMIVDIDMNHPAKNDVIFVDKWSNFRGALTLNNIGSVPFAAGQTFIIFSNNWVLNVPEVPFDMTNKITPAVPGVGLQWNFDNLKTNGIVAVVQVPLTPPTLTTVNTNGTLNFSWEKSHLGYQLQRQTNSLSVGISTNWTPIAGSEYTNGWSVSISQTNPTVFYRLSSQ